MQFSSSAVDSVARAVSSTTEHSKWALLALVRLNVWVSFTPSLGQLEGQDVGGGGDNDVAGLLGGGTTIGGGDMVGGHKGCGLEPGAVGGGGREGGGGSGGR